MNFVFLMDSYRYSVSIFIFLDLLLYFTCMNVLLVFIYVHHMHAWFPRG